MTTGIRTFGLDVSHHNGVVDWDTVIGAAHHQVHFCFAKASQLYRGKSGAVVRQHDAQFDRNWRELGRLAVNRGAYHYCMPEFSAQEMADLFFGVYTPSAGDLVPTIDVEDEYVKAIASGAKTKAQLVAQIAGFGGLIKAKVGRTPFLYIRRDIAEFLGSPAAFADFPLWIANYNNVPAPAIPKPWTDFVLWQYTEKGAWPGFPEASPGKPSPVDFDYLNGAPDRLDAFRI